MRACACLTPPARRPAGQPRLDAHSTYALFALQDQPRFRIQHASRGRVLEVHGGVSADARSGVNRAPLPRGSATATLRAGRRELARHELGILLDFGAAAHEVRLRRPVAKAGCMVGSERVHLPAARGHPFFRAGRRVPAGGRPEGSGPDAQRRLPMLRPRRVPAARAADGAEAADPGAAQGPREDAGRQAAELGRRGWRDLLGHDPRPPIPVPGANIRSKLRLRRVCGLHLALLLLPRGLPRTARPLLGRHRALRAKPLVVRLGENCGLHGTQAHLRAALNDRLRVCRRPRGQLCEGGDVDLDLARQPARLCPDRPLRRRPGRIRVMHPHRWVLISSAVRHDLRLALHSLTHSRSPRPPGKILVLPSIIAWQAILDSLDVFPVSYTPALSADSLCSLPTTL